MICHEGSYAPLKRSSAQNRRYSTQNRSGIAQKGNRFTQNRTPTM
jgi:hypothetical protein